MELRIYLKFEKMAKIKTVIELSEKDIISLVEEKYNIKNCTVSVSHYKGDMREPSYTSITVTGESK